MRPLCLILGAGIFAVFCVQAQSVVQPDAKYLDRTKPKLPEIGWPYLVGKPGNKMLTRDEVVFPVAGGFEVLKADFHAHTIYSDGQVTPEVRVWEAWRDGLDLIAITDHHEFLDLAIPQDRQRANGKVRDLARQLNILLPVSSELTTIHSGKPPHNDYIVSLIEDEQALNTNVFASFKAARDQNGVIIWAHPGPDWSKYAEELHAMGWLDGIELRNTQTAAGSGTGYVNNASFYTHVLDWCLKKNLAIITSSDAHWPIDHMIDRSRGERRDMTLLLVRSHNLDGVREAIRSRRTVAYFGGMLWGAEQWVKSIADSAFEVRLLRGIAGTGMRSDALEIENRSSFAFETRVSLLNGIGSVRAEIYRMAPLSRTTIPVILNTEKQDAEKGDASGLQARF
ncbi:MAG: hypothetical protein H7Y20_17820, partial [Bryobacteraceae bacterium]|nr:hypothetical protein [Bryobacteraceae bacterium]